MAGGTIAVGAALNAAGTLAPAVLALHVAPACASADCLPAGLALLGTSLSLDALFNLLLGGGLIVFGFTLWTNARAPRWLALLVGVAGLAAVPVSLQIVSDAAANWLRVAGPLWLVAIATTSVRLWRGRL
jgi:hypothetical protein